MTDSPADRSEPARDNPRTSSGSVPRPAEYRPGFEARANLGKVGSPDTWLVPLTLLVICVLAYGLLIPWLGVCWDDWGVVWSLNAAGLRSFLAPSSSLHPLQRWAFLPPILLFGNKLVLWHLFALVTRWLIAVALWFCLRSVWPTRSRETFAVAVLSAIYPGFTQQSMPMVYWLLYSQMTFMFASWWLSVRTLRRPGQGVWSHVPAAALLILALAPAEYLFGLELLRPVLMWTALGRTMPDTKLRLRKTILAWIPYVAILAAFVCWRLLFVRQLASDQTAYGSVAAVLARLHAHPLQELLRRAYGVVADLLKAGVFSWIQTLLPLDGLRGVPFGIGVRSIVTWLVSACVGLAAAAVAAVALRPISRREPAEPTIPEHAGSWNRQALAVGFFAICVGGIPFWFAGLGIDLPDGEHFILPLMVGSCLVAAGAVRAVLRTRRLQVLAVLALVALSVGLQVRTAELYRREWARMKSLAWQSKWRVPDVTPGYKFLVEVPPSNAVPTIAHAYSDAFDLIHRPAGRARDADHPFMVLGIANLFYGPSSEKGIWPDSYGENKAVMWISPSGTLWLLDSSRDEHPDLTPLTRAVQHLSNLNAVVSPRAGEIPSAPPVEVFGTEPAHGWLYYFQRICLARQLEQWGWASELADSARQRSLSPQDPCEWLPVIETYLTAGRFKDAESLVVRVAWTKPEARSVLIGLLGRVKARQATSEDLEHAIDDIREELNYAPKDH